MAQILQFDGIGKAYQTFWRRRTVHALEDFSLSVERGEIFGFLGPNGAGKTTAIHLAMGFMRPSYGHGTLLGQPFGHAPTRKRVGFLAENVALYHRPAGALIRFYGELNGIRDPLLARRTRQVLQLVDMTGERHRNVGKFSRGMMQRIGLAQALLNDPELLILDEPTSALDPLGRVSVRELLLTAQKAGKTIFLSSHLLSEIELVCNRIAILHRGRLVHVGKTSELLESRNESEVIAVGFNLDVIPGAELVEGGTRFIVSTAFVRALIERIWALGGEVMRVNPVRRSLEDIFVELTSEPLDASMPFVNAPPVAESRAHKVSKR